MGEGCLFVYSRCCCFLDGVVNVSGVFVMVIRRVFIILVELVES